LALKGNYWATLGLSATPESQYDESFQERIVPALGRVVFRYGYAEARADDVIVPFDLVNVRIPLTASEESDYDMWTRRVGALVARRNKGELVDEGLRAALRRRANVSATAVSRIPVAVELVRRHAGEKAIVFHERIDAADSIAARLVHEGHSVSLYHSRLSDQVRQSNLALFRRGAVDVLVTCRALDEGFNLPEARVGVIASSTASIRQRIQRLGRVLRPAEGKQVAQIYTLYGTDVEEQRLVEEAARMANVARVEWMASQVGSV
jgi:superfamily II DNA or RNA helicase